MAVFRRFTNLTIKFILAINTFIAKHKMLKVCMCKKIKDIKNCSILKWGRSCDAVCIRWTRLQTKYFLLMTCLFVYSGANFHEKC